MPTYTVQSGDTLTSIATQFGVTLAALEADFAAKVLQADPNRPPRGY
jgi:LysM repeat protein